MKLTNETDNKDFGHKKFAFRIDEKHQMKAIWALINLYQHKVQTPVQEIMSNARDAHREVGKPDHTFKVEVTDTQFIVRDYGSGINPDKAQNIFCSIGESTKTGDNNQTGGFGIGAKSPLAYTSQFEVISYVDGTRYHYMIAKNGEALDMNLISQEETKVVNGTKVIVPIKKGKDSWGRTTHDKDKFIKAVSRCCYFWETRPSFNHDIEPLDVFKLKSDSSIGYYNSKQFNGNLAVIDGIPYKTGSYGNKVAFFNTGEIRLHETRERLNDTNTDRVFNGKKIQLKLITAENEFLEQKTLANYVDSDNIFESLQELSKYSIDFRYEKSGLVFNKAHFKYQDSNKSFSRYESRKSHRYPYPCKYYKEVYKACDYETEVFYNDTQDKQQKVTRRVKAYLKQFVDKNEDYKVIVLDSKDQADIFNAKNLSTLEIPKSVRGVKKQSNEITITELKHYGQNRVYRRLDEIHTNYLYLPFGESVCSRLSRFCRDKGLTICLLSKESINRVKDHVKFTEYSEWRKNYTLTENEKKIIYRTHAKYNNVYFTESLDKNMNEYIELNKKRIYPVDTYYVPSVLHTIEVTKELEKIAAENDRIEVLSKYVRQEYPMLDSNVKRNTEYINALYSYRQKVR